MERDGFTRLWSPLTLLLFALFLSSAASHALAATGHNCAPPTPPGIPGPLQPAPAATGVIDMNELLLVPHSTWNCSEHGTYSVATDSWIELYDAQNQPYNLYAAHAAMDNGPNTYVYTFPFGASIAAHGYLVVFPYVNFQFGRTSTLRLLINGVVVDQVTVPKLGADQSFARTTDGVPTWQVCSAPTIDASNNAPQPTPTPPGSHGSGQGGGNGSGSGNQRTGKTISYGRQPTWSKLQFPPATSIHATPTTAVGNVPSNGAPASTSSGNGLGTGLRIILTGLIVASVLAVAWRWRVFKRA